MFATPASPNLADFQAYCLGQNVPPGDIPAGSLTDVSIATSGAISASSTSGTVQAGQVVTGTNIPGGTYLASWSALSGTVSPAPAQAVSATSAQVYSQFLVWALNQAMEIALDSPSVGGGLPGFAGQYVLAVYSLGLHTLLVIGQDQVNQTFFSQMRAKYNLGTLVPGVVFASGDQGTSDTFVVPDFFKTLTLSELELLQTPYGRRYMGYAQMYGPSIVGVS